MRKFTTKNDKYDIYDFVDDFRESITYDYNKMIGSWNKSVNDETLIEFLLYDNGWISTINEYDIYLEENMEKNFI
jgi:hypothetical protein